MCDQLAVVIANAKVAKSRDPNPVDWRVWRSAAAVCISEPRISPVVAAVCWDMAWMSAQCYRSAAKKPVDVLLQ